MNKIFRIDFPDNEPIYIFTKNSWVGLTHIINESHRGGMITPLTYWQFIKEWLNGNKRTQYNKL